MLKHCAPEDVPTAASKHVYIRIPKMDFTGMGVLSPWAPCPTLTVPGTGGKTQASVWAGYNYCKKAKSGGYTEKVAVDPSKTYGGEGVKVLRNASGGVAGLDRTHEQFLFNGRTINFVQARWAILLFMYEQYLERYCSDPIRDLVTIVKKAEPHDVYLYDYAHMTTDFFEPKAPLSYAYLLVDIINRRYTDHPDDVGVDPDVRTEPDSPGPAAA
jgi:hypothetical protein